MKRIINLLFLLLFTSIVYSQPYLDLFHAQYLQSPDAGILNRDKTKHQLSYTTISINAPVKCKPIHGIVVFSPFYEQWNTAFHPAAENNLYRNVALAISFIDTVAKHKWSYSVSPIIRMKDFSKDGTSSAQLGVVGLAIFHKKQSLTYKFGLYFNQDYFGDFLMPLAGIDWRINERDKLFGILPGSLTYEHRKSKNLYYGISFNAITNSYKVLNAQYWKVEDNQLGIYTDIFIFNHTVLNFEFGHSIFRRLSLGEKKMYLTNLNVSDNIYAKISLAYRIRFKE